jgi:hypothetical protein
MRKSVCFILVFTFATGSSAMCQQNELLHQLQQLKGFWKTEIKGKIIFESWKLIDDHEMWGMSYTIKNTDTIIFEQTRIVDRDNQLSYLAKVRSQNNGQEVAFKLISSVNKTFIFENPEHDFPQRVAYQFISADSVHAWIDGKYRGKQMKEDYYYARQE